MRQSGRTTRIIDEAIQTLFTKGSVKIQDHYEGREANLLIERSIMRRLEIEHPHAHKHVERKHRNGITILMLDV